MPVKESKLLEGKVLAQKIQEEIKSKIEKILSKGLERPRLRALQVGQDPSAEWYLNHQEKCASKLGIEFEKISSAEIPDQS